MADASPPSGNSNDEEGRNVAANDGRGDMPKEPRCPLCKGSGVLVCNAAGEPGHDHRFLKDTTEYWCPTCNGIGRIKKGGA